MDAVKQLEIQNLSPEGDDLVSDPSSLGKIEEGSVPKSNGKDPMNRQSKPTLTQNSLEFPETFMRIS